MTYRILVFGAGGPAGVNFTRSAKRAGHWVMGVDPNPLHLPFVEADEAQQCPDHTSPEFLPWLHTTVKMVGIDFLHPQPDQLVMWLADMDYMKKLNARVWLPDRGTIALCQDKFETSWRWARDGLRGSPVQKIEIEEQIDDAANQFGYPFWLRATRGAGARGATPVENRETAVAWLSYWKSRGVDWEWIAEEYLPGRDFAWTSIWHHGYLVVSQARERIEYIYPFLAPSGRTGTPTIAVTRHEPAVNHMASTAVLSIDRHANGVFCVDLREDRNGIPRPTEINAGRFFTTSDFYARAGCNFSDVYIRMGMGEPAPDLPSYDSVKEDVAWMRHVDIPGFMRTGLGL